MIEPKSLQIVGLTRNFKLSSREIRQHLAYLEAEGREAIGVSYAILMWYLTPQRWGLGAASSKKSTP